MGEETAVTAMSSENVTLEAQKKEDQHDNVQLWTHDHAELASLSMKLSDDDCKKLARLKVKCLVAEGRLRSEMIDWMTDKLAKQIGLSWTCRKIERINAFHKLHQLEKLKSDVTVELRKYKNLSIWTRKLIEFKSQIVSRMTRIERILVLLSQYIDRAMFITEYKVVKDIVANTCALKWHKFLLNHSGGKRDDKQSKPDDARYEKVVDELLKPLVSRLKHNFIFEDYDIIQKHGNTWSEKSGMENDGEEEMKINDQKNDIGQNILSQIVQTVEVQEMTRRRKQATCVLKLSRGLKQYDPQNCSFLGSKGLKTRKQVLTVVGKPISAAEATNILEEEVFPVLSVNRKWLQEKTPPTENGQQDSDAVLIQNGPNGLVCFPNVNKSTQSGIAGNVRIDEAVFNNSIVDVETANEPDLRNMLTRKSRTRTKTRNATSVQPAKATRKRRMQITKNQKTISASFEQQLKQLCMKKKCVVKLERLKEPF